MNSNLLESFARLTVTSFLLDPIVLDRHLIARMVEAAAGSKLIYHGQGA
jgi:hypothetical protein